MLIGYIFKIKVNILLYFDKINYNEKTVLHKLVIF